MSSRRNQDRLGAPAPDVSSPLTTANHQEDVFSFVTPTEIIDLPSEGQFYGEDHPLRGRTSIEIRHMTAKEEDILTSESLLRKGIAIDRLLQSLLVDSSVSLEELLVGDKNALIVAARVTGYGPLYETKVACSNCRAAQVVEFDLNTLDVRKSTLPEGVEQTENGTFFVNLPQSNLQVELRLMTGKQERAFMELNERRRKKNLQESPITGLLRQLLVSVQGRDDAKTINKLLEVLPIPDSVHIRNVYEKISPDVDLTHDFQCSSCSHEGRIAVPLTADFFWPNR